MRGPDSNGRQSVNVTLQSQLFKNPPVVYIRFYIRSAILIALQIIAAAVLISFPADVRAVAGLSEAQLRQLKNGEILVGVQQADNDSEGMVTATIMIAASPEEIWRIMLDCPDAPNFVPGLKSCRVLDSGEDWEMIRHETKWIWLLPKITYIFRADYVPIRRIDFARVSGDLREMKGSWVLTPLNHGSRTILRYSVFLDPGFFVPKWMVRKALKADLPDVLTSIRNKIRENQLNP